MALSLLDTPIHVLMERIEGQANDKAIAAALAKESDQPARAAQAVELKKASSKGKGKQRQTDIWTDRYKPKQFTELLGDEVGTNAPLFIPRLMCDRSAAHTQTSHVLA